MFVGAAQPKSGGRSSVPDLLTQMKVLIVGASVAGLATAHSLTKFGGKDFSVRLLDRAFTFYPTAGAAFQIGINGAAGEFCLF